ncbi:uncharacterized protein EDB91DRAFT_1245412 [Suillus paluster]|uniref:uncharacterized protein n=1 Tax=Suillus paluster TaxID=48578 RepID=UPI001B86FCB5|nr:uncharacterized protein EDB91DRAFT_1245412 [Suillus paluster]KAG1747947.1 hypothetical protein EDB91DRAFT_1245412 [Suillus paluster]
MTLKDKKLQENYKSDVESRLFFWQFFMDPPSSSLSLVVLPPWLLHGPSSLAFFGDPSFLAPLWTLLLGLLWWALPPGSFVVPPPWPPSRDPLLGLLWWTLLLGSFMDPPPLWALLHGSLVVPLS